MLGSSQLMAFAATTQPEKALSFYQELLGLKLVAKEPMALVFRCQWQRAAHQRRQRFHSAVIHRSRLAVDDIRSMRRDLAAKGVTFENYGFPGQDAETFGPRWMARRWHGSRTRMEAAFIDPIP